jgi:hypothetical protein
LLLAFTPQFFTSLHFQEEEEAKQQEQRGDEDAELRQGRAEAARERRAPHPHALLRRRALPHQGTLHPDRSVSLATRFTFAPSSCDLMIPGGWLAVTIGGDGVEPEGAVLSRRAAAAVHHIEAGRDGAAAGMYPSFFFFASSSSSSSSSLLKPEFINNTGKGIEASASGDTTSSILSFLQRRNS